ncbi:MAG: helix-turn-helix domain containing protein [Acidimicrobiaceae bacterium]|nr:helix-turn-helix domain containing protein [Acidimicrobiaceae bacterium]
MEEGHARLDALGHCLRVRRERDRRQAAAFGAHGGWLHTDGSGNPDLVAIRESGNLEAQANALKEAISAGNDRELQRLMKDAAVKAYDAGVPHADTARFLDVSPVKVHRWIADEVAARVPD